MARRRVVVLDAERAVAEALAAGLDAALPGVDITTVDSSADGDRGRDVVVVTTWPAAPGSSAPAVLLLAATASAADARAAKAAGPAGLISRAEPVSLLADAVALVLAGARFVSPAVTALLESTHAEPQPFTAAEQRVLAELKQHPDTRSRVAHRLGITTSTLDNHVGAIKRKVLAELLTSENAPSDGYLSMEALIGWVGRHYIA